MHDYGPYYALWRAIAEEFGVPCGRALNPGTEVPTVKVLAGRGEQIMVRGSARAYQPYPANPEGPPVLTFVPDALSHLVEVRGAPAIRYSWVLKSGRRDDQGYLDAGLYFAFSDPAENRALFHEVTLPPDAAVGGHSLECQGYTFRESRFYRRGWTCYRYRLPCDAQEVLDAPASRAESASRAMERLIEHTWEHLVKGWGSQG